MYMFHFRIMGKAVHTRKQLGIGVLEVVEGRQPKIGL